MHLKNHNHQDLFDLGNKVADKIREIGFIGPFNIDFIETTDGLYPVECNARFCASLYTSMLNEIMTKRHGDNEHSLTLSYTGLIGIRNFRQLQERVGSMLYDGTNIDCRIIPINVGHLNHGRVVVSFTSKSETDLTEMQKTFGNYLNIGK